MRVEYIDLSEYIRRIDEEIYDKEEYQRALKWVKENCKEGSDINEVKNPEKSWTKIGNSA